MGKRTTKAGSAIRAKPAVTSTAAAIVSSIRVFTVSPSSLRNSIFDLELSNSFLEMLGMIQQRCVRWPCVNWRERAIALKTPSPGLSIWRRRGYPAETRSLVSNQDMQKTIATLLLLVGISATAADQKAKTIESQIIPVATQTLLDGVKSTGSKKVIKSVLMLECPRDGMKGTGFVLSDGGIITTNSHVVGNCSADEMIGISAVGTEPVKFQAVEKDSNRDLALLCPSKPLPFSLELNGDENPLVETEVETWGYPLSYKGPAPLLSRGYVAGYTMGKDSNGQPTNPPVQHLIVNGAINLGNSGGRLVERATGKVIGIVVQKWTLGSALTPKIIDGLQNSKTATLGGLPVSNEAALAIALKEIYVASQVMIGEAISVSELNAFIKEKREAVACGSH